MWAATPLPEGFGFASHPKASPQGAPKNPAKLACRADTVACDTPKGTAVSSITLKWTVPPLGRRFDYPAVANLAGSGSEEPGRLVGQPPASVRRTRGGRLPVIGLPVVLSSPNRSSNLRGPPGGPFLSPCIGPKPSAERVSGVGTPSSPPGSDRSLFLESSLGWVPLGRFRPGPKPEPSVALGRMPAFQPSP